MRQNKQDSKVTSYNKTEKGRDERRKMKITQQKEDEQSEKLYQTFKKVPLMNQEYSSERRKYRSKDLGNSVITGFEG